MNLKPWREIIVPHPDVLNGTFQQSEFAADLTAVHTGKATPEYGDAKAFYERTFITEGMNTDDIFYQADADATGGASDFVPGQDFSNDRMLFHNLVDAFFADFRWQIHDAAPC